MLKNIINKRRGARLEDGKAAHAADHHLWSRRQFLSNSGIMAAGGAFMGSASLFSWASPLVSSLFSNPDNDRVLILIRLVGGNDGLNTIVPFCNSDAIGDYQGRRSVYEDIRQTIGLSNVINDNELNPLNVDYCGGNSPADFGLPTRMSGAYNMWNDGNMAVIHNVGYPNQNGSHFTSSDLWASGASNGSNLNDERAYSGWMGRYFKETLPAFLDAPPTVPPAIQIGSSHNLIFRGRSGNPYDLIFSDLAAFQELLDTGGLYSAANFSGNCPKDIERTFVRRLANSAYRYSDTVIAAHNHPDAKNDPNADYGGVGINEELKTIVKLIKGHLKTKIYLVQLGGFDTHVDQRNIHLGLLDTLSQAVHATFKDLQASGDEKRVMMMTFSEFGRTIAQNSGLGTDHGFLAPVMLFGDKINGKKFYGTPINLSGYDSSADFFDEQSVAFGNQAGAIDFRSVYDRVLRDWLCADVQTSEDVLNYGVAENNHEDVNNYSNNTEGDPENYSDADCTIVPSDPAHCQATTSSHNMTDPLGGLILGGCNSTVSQSSPIIASQVLFGYNVRSDNQVEFKYSIKSPANVQLEILNENGSKIQYDTGEKEENGDTIFADLQPLFTQFQEAGSHIHTFKYIDTDDDNDITFLQSNTKYICRLSVAGMVVEKVLKIH